MCGSNVRRKGQGTQGRHAVGEEAPAREIHENRFPTPYPITWQSLRDLSEIFDRKRLTSHKQS